MSDSNTPGATPEAKARGHEFTSVKLGPILFAGAVLFGILVVSMFAMKGLYSAFESIDDRDALPPMAAARQLPPSPRLQTDPRGDIAEHAERVDALLTEYAWVDEEAGIVRIPLDRAMELVTERGLPIQASEGGE